MSIDSSLRPFVIVGAGPVGLRMMQELSRLFPNHPIHLYGAETWQPYNRVQLASVLAGEKDWLDIINDIDHPNVHYFSGCSITQINPNEKYITDANGNTQFYRELILATGSTPWSPPLSGIEKHGVYVFRNLEDALKLSAFKGEPHQVVVVGGGLLGIEAANALRQPLATVTLIEMSDHLMPKHIDRTASSILVNHLQELGIAVILEDEPIEILGEQDVTGIKLKSGRIIDCDSVILSTGVTPNIQLAQRAGIEVNKGIVVDEFMRTSMPHIFAVGECIEHQGQTVGLLAPGLEQAAVAAHIIAGQHVHYTNNIAASKLKLLSQPVFSMGEIHANGVEIEMSHAYIFHRNDIYRKVIIRHGKIIGALALGDWGCIPRLQEAICNARPIRAWQLWLFQRNGTLWKTATAEHVQEWPQSAVVCNCTGVTRGQLSQLINQGCTSIPSLTACSGAGGVCGSCKPLLAELVGSKTPREAVVDAKKLYKLSTIVAITSAALLLLPSLPYSNSIEQSWDLIWRNNIAKQISGFSLLFLSFALASLSLRKRNEKLKNIGNYASWRMQHIFLGISVLLVFLVHTGGSFGENLSFLLSVSYIGAALIGGIFAMVIAREHLMDNITVRETKNTLSWGHIMLLAPIPVLLGFHIARGYLF